MSNREFEMYQYRQALVRMRQGESDRAIAQSGLMGRKKLKVTQAGRKPWLAFHRPSPA